ncbi:hypothetical protein VHEMI09217 [[Torrubiella] hemipterigena]|uniref:Uncharacterized protein n=1 Tax=[Torrubiella] hemipterigena TaxID=1531966 RepID=A0A0A1T956_9HYPO|nr:hypothetical protein VHEMI09217 [[Torrubiella] hemipterigena]
MAQQPSTPVKVPASATTYSPATLDPDLRSQINTILLRDGHVSKIQERLLHTLNSNASNWPTALQDHALTLLRSGQVQTFPALLRQVLDDIQEASAASSSSTSPNKSKPKANGVNGTAADKSALAVPQVVVDEVLSVTRECLKDVCEIEEPNGRVN